MSEVTSTSLYCAFIYQGESFHEYGNGYWTLIGGIAAIILGIMIMNKWPVSGLWVIGMFVAIELIFNGWGMVMAALAVRNFASRSQ